jgi:IS5 family transposase
VPELTSDSACGAEPRTARRKAIDERTTQHESYRISQIKRKRIEECFGWLKTIALLRKVRHRGIFKVDWVFSFACAAYNLVRMRNLSKIVIQAA